VSQISSYLSNDWRNIIWREWRNTDDEEYAQQLFELVADEPVGWGPTVIIILLSIAIALLVSLSLTPIIGGIINIVAPDQMWIIFVWFILASIIGGLVGILGLSLLGKDFSWRIWLGWLTPLESLSDMGKNIDPQNLRVQDSATVTWIIMLFLHPVINVVVFLISTLIDWTNEKLRGEARNGIKFQGSLTNIVTDVSKKNVYQYRAWWFWWRKQPKMAEVEMALREAYEVQPEGNGAWTEPLHHLESQMEQSASPYKFIANLHSGYWATRFVARYTLVSLAGEAMEPLGNILKEKGTSMRKRTAARLLKNVEIETTTRLADKAATLACSQCVVRCHAHQIRLSLQKSFTYYGCRVCHQSREFIEFSGEVVAVLDQAWREEQSQQNGLLRVNWLTRRNLFDSDRVEIIQATDEEVERFAVQVGNDTDAVRKPRYKEMSCLIAPDCHLSENTWRILRSLFGEVGSFSSGHF